MPSTQPSPGATGERRQRIADLVTESGYVPVTELSRAFGVSTVTVRGDLDALAALGSLRRIRGGAMPLDPTALRERSFEEASDEAASQKARIAAAAADMVEPGMSVLLDVGTTTAALAAELLRRDDLDDVTVITNGLSLALALEPAIPRLQVIVTGGTLRPRQHSLVSPLAAHLLDHIHADIAFIGCNGVDAAAGVTNINLPEAEVKRTMVGAATTVVVLADGSKVGHARVGRVAPITDVDVLITDETAPADALAELERVDRLRVLLA